ncbi:MAG TPA: GTPase [Gemmataceae bacterium]|nr:GTPase [Gemmataceae bacterium]
MSLVGTGETMVACLTPPGKAAIATLSLWGPRAWDVVRQLFRARRGRQPQLPAKPERGPLWFGQLGEATSEEVVVTLKEAGPVPGVEIHCHGGHEVIRLLLETLAAQDVQVCSWQELFRRTSTDTLRSAAAIALADAITVRTAAILLDQYHGALDRAIQTILTCWAEGESETGSRLLQDLVRHVDLGRHLTSPWRLVVAGAPNVGKSSLINALAGYQRCVVAHTPGTTRDLVTVSIAIDGWPIELTDTAGLRPTAERLEEQGMDRARQAVEAADLCLWVLDGSAPPVWPADQTQTMRFVVNKVDLEAAWDWDQAAGAVPVSALTASGLAELCDAVSGWLVPQVPPPGAAVPFTPQLSAQIEAAWRCHAAGHAEEARQILATMRCSPSEPGRTSG